jgi:predicted nucleic acid-binding protein
MMIYLDTSYIVKCYLNEPGTTILLKWLKGKSGLTCSMHGRLELIAAFKRHVREGHLLEKQLLTSLSLLEKDERAGIWNWIPLSSELIHEACKRVSALPSNIFIRSADALHLACAAENGFASIYSHDRHLLAAAEYFGLEGEDIL